MLDFEGTIPAGMPAEPTEVGLLTTVTVLVINGSLPTPSTWSRRRIPTHLVDPGASSP